MTTGLEGRISPFEEQGNQGAASLVASGPGGRSGRDRAGVSMSLAASPVALEILRSVAGRVSRLAGFSYNGIEDLAMAVDEAATILLETSPRDLDMVIAGPDPGGRLRLSLSATEPTKSLHLAELRSGYRWDLLEALCEEVWWVDTGTSIGLSQSVR